MAMLLTSSTPVHPHACGDHGRWGHSIIDLARFIPTRVGTTPFRYAPSGGITVHPHACGDHVVSPPIPLVLRGSSPHAWRPQTKIRAYVARTRFIPTCVETTASDCEACEEASVHPHMRGDHEASRGLLSKPSGSSPRAWEPPRQERRDTKRARFIPTCVGTTQPVHRTSIRHPVHPHVRGNHSWCVSATCVASGSSPRAWEPQAGSPAGAYRYRFIPTCVGTTRPDHPARPRPPVHPHVRGNHIAVVGRGTDGHGSSPRAWEPHRGLVSWGGASRFIPTCVGTTSNMLLRTIMCTVHPHVRGNHSLDGVTEPFAIGSSPRAWEPRYRDDRDDSCPRFIPTCVGTTGRAGRRSPARPVHPHVRGNHRHYRTRNRVPAGSSPRAWEPLPLTLPALAMRRFIPTCVGTTWCVHPCGNQRTVHPHVRGNHGCVSPSCLMRSGSSPRAWEPRRWTYTRMQSFRFIPTCVGTTKS